MRSRFATHSVALAASCLLMAALAGSAHGSRFFGMGDLPPGENYSNAYGVSTDGLVVVGESNSVGGAYRWTSGAGTVGLGFYYAYGVSADGSVVVGSNVNGGLSAVRWSGNEGVVSLGGLPGGNHNYGSCADGVSADGSVIVGYSDSTSGYEAFRWTSGAGMVGLGDLPGGNRSSMAYGVSADGSVVVGMGSSASGVEAFRWTERDGMVGLGHLPGGDIYSWAFGVSPDGSVIVGYSNSSVPGREEAFRWTSDDGMVGLGYLPGGNNSYATSASANGSAIVGVSNDSSGAGNEAFIWDASNGMRKLREVLLRDAGDALDGWTLNMANAISPDGRKVVGWGTNPSGQREAWLAYLETEVPEPSSWILVGVGLTLLLMPRPRLATRDVARQENNRRAYKSSVIFAAAGRSLSTLWLRRR